MLYTVDEFRQRLETPLPKPHLVLIGDVHGEYEQYREIIERSHCSLQVGDLVGEVGEEKYEELFVLGIDSIKHRFIGGNHEPYSTIPRHDLDPEMVLDPAGPLSKINNQIVEFVTFPAHCLGHYGVWKIPDVEPVELSGDIFYVRGAWSIDELDRQRGYDVFDEEELTYQQCADALNLYAKVKPDFVVTHTCPQFVQEHLHLRYKDGKAITTRTGQTLERMFHAHQPKIWVFGHYHQDMVKIIGGTLFVCLDRCSTIQFDKELRIILP